MCSATTEGPRSRADLRARRRAAAGLTLHPRADGPLQSPDRFCQRVGIQAVVQPNAVGHLLAGELAGHRQQMRLLEETAGGLVTRQTESREARNEIQAPLGGPAVD